MSRRKRTTEEDDLEEIRKGFEMFDVDGTGIINPAELLEAMDSMNIKDKNPFIYEIIESLNSEKEFRKQGGVTLEDLVNYVYNKVNDTETNVGIRQIYDVINDRDTDTVSMSTFYTLAKDYGDKLSEDEIRYLLEKTQMGGEDLNFDEFYTIMKGAVKDNNKINNSYMNASRSSYRNNDVYIKKSSNSNTNSIKRNKVDNNRKIRTKKFIYEEPKQLEYEEQQENIQEQEINQPYEEPNIQNMQYEEEPRVVQEIITTKKIINQNEINDNDNDNDNNNYNDNNNDFNNDNNNNDNENINEENNNININNNNNYYYPPSNKEENEEEIKNEIQENNENNEPQSENNDNTPLKYSYRKVHIGSTPKYEKVIEKHVNVEEENNAFLDNNLNDNLNINENIENNGDKVFKEKQTKITNLPEGGKQIEITEKTEIVKERPYIRGRYRFSKKNDEKENNEDEKKEEKNTYYRIRRPRGGNQNNNEKDQVSANKVEIQENKEVIIPKRYHRRYRDTKSTTNNDN
jgi:Ca2+-binding EF-hand superfamily protein